MLGLLYTLLFQAKISVGLSSVCTVSCKISDRRPNSYRDTRCQELTSEISYCFCVDSLGDIWKCKVTACGEGSNLGTGLFRFRVFQDIEDPGFQDSRDVDVVELSAFCTGRLYLPGNIVGIHLLEAESNPRP
jgi:hypothetical protein